MSVSLSNNLPTNCLLLQAHGIQNYSLRRDQSAKLGHDVSRGLVRIVAQPDKGQTRKFRLRRHEDMLDRYLPVVLTRFAVSG